MENPWVAQVVAEMPVFRPKVMIRLCYTEPSKRGARLFASLSNFTAS